MTTVQITWSDGHVDNDVFDVALSAFEVFKHYQKEVDHPEWSAAERGSLVPVKVAMINA